MIKMQPVLEFPQKENEQKKSQITQVLFPASGGAVSIIAWYVYWDG